MRRALIILPALVFCVAGCTDVRKAAPATTTQLPALSSSAASSSQPPAKTSGSASPTSTAAQTGLSAFVGDWNGHGRLLTVGADGSGKIVVRTYQKCGDPGVSGPCDTFDGDEIKPGAVTQIKISGTHQTEDGLVADFTVEETTLGLPPGSAGTLILDQAQDSVRIVINGKPGSGSYCGPKADPGACGA